MPRLVHASEKIGCGATVELDSGDFCMVSVARTGVLVRTYRKGQFLGSFFGANLYKETDLYKTARTAMALAALYPDQEPQLTFSNPVLAAFANGVWQCSNAAEVCKVLNEAIEKAAPVLDAIDRIHQATGQL
jgi:hypothetical protein